MLFFSFEFMFVFLPLALAGYFTLQRLGRRFGVLWLVLASLVYYGYWNPDYVVLLGGSLIVNYFVGVALQRTASKWLLAFGVGFDLGLIGYFKYANFFVDAVDQITSSGYSIDDIVLPLAISFFTFQQIAWLVDSYKGKVDTSEDDFANYALFVTFFPQLIAGPIVHHAEMMPQFASAKTRSLDWDHIAKGLTIFIIGLTKKVVIADGAAPVANAAFAAAADGVTLGFLQAWSGALAYTVQLYFDFSGYADMAIGLALLFNIVLPLNFDSPYQSTSIIEFWRRWHMTLSRFLRDYLYIPLGGNRKGRYRRYVNVLITMLLGGLWHGAGWTFLFWGLLHGGYLVLNQAWRAIAPIALPRPIAGALTFLAVVVGWVFFRAESFDVAVNVLQSMVGISSGAHTGAGARSAGISGYGFTLLGLAIAFLLPNSQQWMQITGPTEDPLDGKVGPRLFGRNLAWQVSVGWAVAAAGLALLSIWILLDQNKIQEFIYFQF